MLKVNLLEPRAWTQAQAASSSLHSSEYLQTSHPTPTWTDSQRDKGATPCPDTQLPLVGLYWKALAVKIKQKICPLWSLPAPPNCLLHCWVSGKQCSKGLSGFLSWISSTQVYSPSATREQKLLLNKHSGVALLFSCQLVQFGSHHVLGTVGPHPQFLSV